MQEKTGKQMSGVIDSYERNGTMSKWKGPIQTHGWAAPWEIPRSQETVTWTGKLLFF